MYKYQNYIFDLDGTIVNSSEEVLRCFRQAFTKSNVKIIEENFTSDVIGPPLIDIIKMLSPNILEESIQDIITNFRKIYDYEDNDISVIYNGIYDLLLELKKQGCKLFIATFKPNIPTMRLAKLFHLDEIFEDIYTIDKFGKKISKEDMISDIISSYNFEKSQTVMIGDAASDMIAAKGAGIDGIGVLWGYGSDKNPLKENATHTVKNVEELRKCLK